MSDPRTARVVRSDLALGMALYALQGVVVAYLVNYNKTYMIRGGVAERPAVLAQTAVLLTLVFKFLLGPLSDRFSPFGLGHRRPFIVLGLLAQSAGLVGLASIHPGAHLAGFAMTAFVAVAGLALYDTCCDGLMVDVTPEGDRPRVQGLLQVARFLATMACTLVFGLWMDRTGVGPGRSEAVLYACAALGLPALLMAVRAREPIGTRSGLSELTPTSTPHPSPPPQGGRGLSEPSPLEGEGRVGGRVEAAEGAAYSSEGEGFDWRALRTLGRPGALALIAFGTLYGMVGIGAEFNLSRFYDRLGYGQGEVGLFGALRYGGRAAGALLLPALNGRLGRRGELVVGIVAMAAATAGQAASIGRPVTGALAFAFGLASGWNDALFCVLAMEAADPRMAASTFAIYMAVSNLSVVGDALFSEAVALVGRGFGPVFLGAGGLGLLLLGLVPALSRGKSSRRALADVYP